MANSFEIDADYIAAEVLRLVTNPLEISPAFNTDYNKEFTKDYARGDTVQVKFPPQFIGGDTDLSWQPENIVERSTTVKIDKVAKVHFEVDSIEAALKMGNPAAALKPILKSAAETVKQRIETACAQWATDNTPNFVGTHGTNPTTFDSVFGAAGQKFTEHLAFEGGKMFLTPAVTRTLRASAVAQFNPASELERQWKKGVIGETNNFTAYQSNSLVRLTSSTWAGAVTVTTAPVSGATTLSLTCTTGDTFRRGDKFTIAATDDANVMTKASLGYVKQFTIVGETTVTGVASAATIQIYPPIYGPGSPYQNVVALPAAAAALTKYAGSAVVGTVNLAIGPDAFALVGVPLADPGYGPGTMANGVISAMSSRMRDPKSGLSISFIRGFNLEARKWQTRIETAFGFGNFYADRSACAVLGLN